MRPVSSRPSSFGRRRRGLRRPERGFTLIELMVSLVLFSVVIAGMLAVAVTIPRGYREQQLTITAENSARASMDFMAAALRGASPASPTQQITHVSTPTCPTNALVVEDNTTAPGTLPNTDRLTMVFASGAVKTSLRALWAGGTTMTVENAAEFSAGDTVLVSDLTQGHLARVAAVTLPNQLTVDAHTCGVAPSYPAGSLVLRAARVTFQIEDLDGVPTLMMDPDAEGNLPTEPFAEGVEDLQIAVGVDANNDGSIAEVGLAAGDDEWSYNFTGETGALPAGAVRAIRVSLVARTATAFTGQAVFNRPAIENRAAGGADQFRRRVLTSIVEIRNLGGSP